MASEASLATTTASATRREPSSTLWFWWKESRQLAPLVALLIAVAVIIVLSGTLMASYFRWISRSDLSSAALLIFPGLFATGAGPLLVGQERSTRTMDWLASLPISIKRLTLTKFLVALSGLSVMWLFAVTMLWLIDSGSQSWRFNIGGRHEYSFDGSMSLSLFITHSVFVLVAGFYVAWRIRNQFYSLIALVPLAFAPFIATSIVSGFSSHIVASSQLEWINFWFILVGIAAVAPLGYRAAIKALSPEPAPPLQSLMPYESASPAKQLNDAIPPRFGTQLAPIVWQSFHSARGMFIVLIVMLLIAMAATITLAVPSSPFHTTRGLAPFLIVAAPLAVSWLGVSVFKHDGATERIRFLSDRGISNQLAYCGLHAIPFAIVSLALLIYALWNLWVPHHEHEWNHFARSLPTMIPMLFFGFAIYSVSQWVSQMMRTMILAIILAPIAALLICGWLGFSFAALGFPMWAMAICGVLPLVTTRLLMRRYADGTDRPLSFIAGAIVASVIVAFPVAWSARLIYEVPTVAPELRSDLLVEARQFQANRFNEHYLSLSGRNLAEVPDLRNDPVEEMEWYLNHYTLSPDHILKWLPEVGGVASANLYEYSSWHGSFLLHRLAWKQDSEQWSEFAPWLTASAALVQALRRSSSLESQEVADRLEVVLLDTLAMKAIEEHRDDPSVVAAVDAIGTPESRAVARRRSLLVSWLLHTEYEENRRSYLGLTRIREIPPGLVDWIGPRVMDQFLLSMLNAAEAAQSPNSNDRWRRDLHHLFDTGGVFETSRYGDRMYSMPAMQTMTIGNHTGFGQLWGKQWEFVRPESLLGDASTSQPPAPQPPKSDATPSEPISQGAN